MRTAAIAIAVLGLSAPSASAIDRTWSNPAGGNFNVGSNWSPAGVPVPGDSAFFNLMATYIVDIGQTHSNTSTFISAGDVTFSTPVLSQPYFINNDLVLSDASLTLTDIFVFVADDTNVGDGVTFTVEGGADFQFNKINLSNSPGASALLRVRGVGSAINSFNPTLSRVSVGTNGGDGTLELLEFSISDQIGNVNICDSNVAETTGTVLVDSGAELYADVLRIATNGGTGQSGSLTIGRGCIVDAGSVVDAGHPTTGTADVLVLPDGVFDLGSDGNAFHATATVELQGGTLEFDGETVFDGSTVTLDAASVLVFDAGNDVTFRNEATATLAPSIDLSTPGTNFPGTINLESGSRFAAGLTATFGSAANTAGGLTVDGVSANQIRSEFFTMDPGPDSDLRVGVGGEGTVMITGGGCVRVRDDGVFADAVTGRATVVVSGGDVNAGPSELDLTNGGPNGELIVGEQGDADLDVLDGARVLVGGDGFIARQASSQATVSIIGMSGAGVRSMLVLGDDFFIGGGAFSAGGIGDIDVDGGTITSNDLLRVWDTSSLTLSNDAIVSCTLFDNRGTLSGSGAIVDALTSSNAGVISPGTPDAAGRLEFFRDVFQTATGELRIDLFGMNPGEFDTISADGDLTILGDLVVNVAEGFDPGTGSTFDIIEFTGTPNVAFDSVTMTPGYDATVDLVGNVVRVTLEQVEIPCPWDCAPDNGDGTFGNGVVNIDDVLGVINEFGLVGASTCDNSPDNGDGTFGNGVVNIDDVLGVINNSGPCP